jgi:hypothetical protein
MNTYVKISIYFFLLLVSSQATIASTITAISSNGNWASSSTWDLNRIPNGHDNVIIPNGKKVVVNSNLYNAVPTRPKLHIDVYGVLELEGGSGQLNLECGSVLNVYGDGIIPNTGCNCNQIAIGLGNAVWKGEFSASVVGGQSITGPCVLPLDLLSFEIMNTNGLLFLQWSTASEVNVSHFEVEQSTDGLTFVSVGSVNAGKALYSFVLNEIAACSFYRLKMVDFDNTVQYSQIIENKNVELLHLNIYPNPSVNGGFNVSITDSEASEVVISMTDMLGNSIAVQLNRVDSQTVYVSYPNQLAAGLYSIAIVQNAKVYSKSILVQ